MDNLVIYNLVLWNKPILEAWHNVTKKFKQIAQVQMYN